MLVTVSAPSCARALRDSTCLTLPASGHRLAGGHPAKSRCRQRDGRAEVDRRNCCAAMPSISRSRSRSLRLICPQAPGGTSPGAKALQRRSLHGLHACGCASLITYKLGESRPEEWLLIEWPKEEKEPTKYWLSTLPEDISFRRLVDYAKLRWRIEHDYKELKQEVGLGDFEGRGWRGFHHHATISIAVYGFLISERGAFSPSGPIAKVLFPPIALPKSYRPRGSAAAT